MLVVANLVATVLRFVLLRSWVFRERHGAHPSPMTEPRCPRRPTRRSAAGSGRLVRGREEDPAWVRPALLACSPRRALLYLVGLSASGWANGVYSAAVQAGDEELEGVLLRLLRLVELHHRRQAAGRRSG